VILCVAANPSIDRLFDVERLEPGEIHRPAQFAQVPGGKGLNVARAAAALGGDVRAAALLGGHAGRWMAEGLAREGIPLDAAWAEAETRSSLSVSGHERGLTEFYEHGHPVTPEEWRGFAEVVASRAPAAAWVTISGSLPPGAPADGYLPMIAAGQVAFDSREAGLEARPALVKLNSDEAAEVTRCAITDAAGAASAARALHEATGGTAIVTRGGDGAVMVVRDGVALSGNTPSQGRYPVGSGDAFLAGLVVALDRGAGWETALAAAIGAGSANAETPGAGVLERGRAEELAAAVEISEV
jgi:1-phosphofructokinase family hexose kinase